MWNEPRNTRGLPVEWALFGGLIAAVTGLVWLLLTLTEPPRNVNCYSVVDRAGYVYESFEPTDAILTDGGGVVVVYNTEQDWGFVYGPVTTAADKDCLRERGVKVPPVAGSDN